MTNKHERYGKCYIREIGVHCRRGDCAFGSLFAVLICVQGGFPLCLGRVEWGTKRGLVPIGDYVIYVCCRPICFGRRAATTFGPVDAPTVCVTQEEVNTGASLLFLLSTCGARLDFCREKVSSHPFPSSIYCFNRILRGILNFVWERSTQQ